MPLTFRRGAANLCGGSAEGALKFARHVALIRKSGHRGNRRERVGGFQNPLVRSPQSGDPHAVADRVAEVRSERPNEMQRMHTRSSSEVGNVRICHRIVDGIANVIEPPGPFPLSRHALLTSEPREELGQIEIDQERVCGRIDSGFRLQLRGEPGDARISSHRAPGQANAVLSVERTPELDYKTSRAIRSDLYVPTITGRQDTQASGREDFTAPIAVPALIGDRSPKQKHQHFIVVGMIDHPDFRPKAIVAHGRQRYALDHRFSTKSPEFGIDEAHAFGQAGVRVH